MNEVRRPRVIGLAVDPDETLPSERYRFGSELSRPDRLVALARALASSPAWADLEDAILVVRTEPPEGLAFIGHIGDAEAARIGALANQLRTQVRRLRYVGWRQVEEDCELLAERLVALFGRDEVRSMEYAAIPRGGHIVLGILSYALELDASRLAPADAGGAPLVVVDDCALTGVRFGEFLRGRPERRVVFAHLYSHPDLRAAIVSREPGVIDAVAARNLLDFAPEVMGQEYAAWADRWMRRSDGRCYWIGRPEHVCFPWSEPDFAFWNPVSDSEEPGWRLAPPEACLKNRIRASSTGPQIQVQPPGAGPIRPADRTFYGELRGSTIAASLDGSRAVRLDGVAADMWTAIVRLGDLERAARALAAEYDADAAEIRKDLLSFAADLDRRGLLTRLGSPGGGDVG